MKMDIWRTERKNTKKHIGLFIIPAALLCIVMLTSCGVRKSSYTGFAMGSLITADIYSDGGTADRIWLEANKAVSDLDAAISVTDKDSELSRLNESAEFECGKETAELIERSLEIGSLADGTIDITLGALTSLWGFTGGEPRVPSPEEINTALSCSGIEKVTVDDKTGTVKKPAGLKLDPGAVGKGAGADAALEKLREYGSPAVFSLGGTVLLYSKPSGRESWSVGIRDPFGDASSWFAVFASAPENDGAVFISTSGSYEKQFTQNGKTYHHILDPETGYPVETDLLGVTVISDSGLLSDALSTACFVSGLNGKTLSLLDNYNAGAVFVFKDRGVYVTEGIKDCVTLTDDSFYYCGYEE